jgi:hypothetical protein
MTLTVYFAENTNALFQVTGAPVAARAAFLAALQGSIYSEPFSGYVVGDAAPLDILFTGSSGDILATIQGDGKIEASNIAGRFNTSPPDGGIEAWWRSNGAGGLFSIDFAQPIAAFGFYGTDVGDFNGRLIVTLRDTQGADTVLPVAHTQPSPNAALLFWGFVDSAKTYTRISFSNTSGLNNDVFGFDDMVIADSGQIVPPPAPPSIARADAWPAGTVAV